MTTYDAAAVDRDPTPVGPRDQGAALILTLFATTLAMIIGTTILTSTVSNLRSARLSLDATTALDAAEAGVAQAAAHLRTFGVAGIACAPTCASGYGSEASPTAVTLPGGARYRVWVEPLAPLPTNNPGRYLVHSTGYAGDGVREIETEVSLGTQPIGLPLAIFARSVTGGGNAAVTRESIISTGCVWARDKIFTTGIDLAYKIPAAVHSSQYVSESQGSSADCGPSNKAIHRTSTCGAGPSGQRPSYRWDHSIQGGAFAAGSPCATEIGASRFYASQDLDGDGTVDVVGSRIRDEASLRTLFGIPERPFTDAQLDVLREVAVSQGTYFTTAGYDPMAIPAPVPTSGRPTRPHTLLFFDLKGAELGKTVDLKAIRGWGRPASGCPDQSLVIVIVGGNAKLNGEQAMVANLVLTSPAPYGYVFKANGTADLIGTIYADTVDLTGTVDVSLDECFLQNLAPSLVDTTLEVTDYREVDRTD